MLPAATSLLVRLLWPARCVACRALVAEDTAFCAPCAISVSALGRACRGCAMELGGSDPVCRPCLDHPPPFRAARASLLYGAAVADAIIGFKHGRRLAAARPLGRMLTPLLAWAEGEGVDAVLPVPLHPRRLRRRGFNQALELAREAAREHRRAGGRHVPVLVDTLVRLRDTPALGHDPPVVRRQRVAGAFAVRQRKRGPGPVEGRRLLVVDDVMTTGATLAECARTLVGAGAHFVLVAALARAL